MTRRMKILSGLFLFGMLFLGTFLVNVGEVGALRMRGDENLCMCAIRRPAPPPPPPPKAAKQPQQPAQKPKDNDEEPPPPRRQPPPVPTACTPTYNAPTLSLGGYSPAYPLVLGQDPDKIGVDVTITAQGGSKRNSCPGDARGTITAFQLNQVTLSPEAIAWIQGELQKAYPGARVLGSYPLHPSASVSLGSNATLRFHFDPQDPGAYNITATARQQDGQSVTRAFQVPAHLLEATISW